MFSFVAFAGIDYLSRTFESWDIPGTSSSSSTLSTLRQASACSLFPYLQQKIAFQTAYKRRNTEARRSVLSTSPSQAQHQRHVVQQCQEHKFIQHMAVPHANGHECCNHTGSAYALLCVAARGSIDMAFDCCRAPVPPSVPARA